LKKGEITMVEAIKIGNISVMPGEMKRGAIAIGKNMYGIERELPVIVYRGLHEGKCLWITGSTHGDEPEGPFSIKLLMDRPELDPAKMSGTLVLVPALNVEALMDGRRGDPRDAFSYDMNRFYPGKPDGYPSERVAWAFHEIASKYADLHLAIHSGGDHSMLCRAFFAPENPESLELGKALGPEWDLALTSNVGGTGNPTSVFAGMGKGALTVEHGGYCRCLTTEFVEVCMKYVNGYINIMKHYHMIEGESTYADKWYRGHQIALLANASGLFVGADVPLREMIKKGTVLGHIYNLYGDVLETLTAPTDGQVFGLRYRPSVIEGEWCCFFGAIDEIRNDLMIAGKSK